jgi:hypothetical protein
MTHAVIASPASPKREDLDQEVAAFEERLTHDFDQIWVADASGDYRELADLQHLMQPRDVAIQKVMRIDMWPKGVWIEATVVPEEYAHRVTAITFHAQGWLRHGCQEVSPDEYPSIWRYAQHIAATF